MMMTTASAHTAPLSATAMHSTTVREVMHPGIMACTATADARVPAREIAAAAPTQEDAP
jgi:hypothetical protein